MQRRQTGACVCPAAERARGTAPACTVRVGTHSQLTGKTTKLNMHVHARRSVSCLSRASCFHSLRPTEASGHFPPNTRKRKLVLGLKLVRLSEFRVFLRRFLGSSCTLLEQIPTGFCAVFNGSRRCTDAAGGECVWWGAAVIGSRCYFPWVIGAALLCGCAAAALLTSTVFLSDSERSASGRFQAPLSLN